MTIIFNYLFTPSEDGFITRVPVRILKGQPLPKGLTLTTTELGNVDLRQWVGKSLEVTIRDGVHTISGLAV